MKKGIWVIGFVCLLIIAASYNGPSVLPANWGGLFCKLVYAEQVSEPSIRIYDGDNLFTISLEDIRKYHGSVDPCGAYAIKAVQLAVSKLWGETPTRKDFRIYTSHPCPTSRDAFEFITRGKESRDFLFVNPEELLSISRGLTDSMVRYKFIIVRKSTGDAILLKPKPKEKIAPKSLLKLIEKYKTVTPKEKEILESKFKEPKKEFMATLLRLPAEKVFDFKVVMAPSE